MPGGAVDTTRLQVAGRDLPLQGTVGFELFNSSSIGLTEFAQRINLQRALQGELARTIMSIDGVEAARVHLSLGEQSAFRGDRRPPRASVSVRDRAGPQRCAPATVRGIQRLVAGSVPEMDLANVAVLNDRGALVSADVSAEAAAAPREEERRRVERFFETAHPPRRRGPLSRRRDRGQRLGRARRETAPPRPMRRPWPTARDYRLRATVAIAHGPQRRRPARQLARWNEAIGFSDALGDSVTVTASAPACPANLDRGRATNGRSAGASPDRPREPRADFAAGLPVDAACARRLLVAHVRRCSAAARGPRPDERGRAARARRTI